MRLCAFASRVFVALCLCVFAVGAHAQPAVEVYEPQLGEFGKDVIWLPSANAMVVRMLDVAKVTARDTVVDLGSGDGRTVIAAAKRGARALGVEFNPDLVEYSRRMAEKARMGDRARFVQGDLFEADLAQATVITLFLLEDINLKLRPKLLELKPGTRVVSNYFTMGDWKPDRTLAAGPQDGCTMYCLAQLWIVPARVDGTWRLPHGELRLKQSYQMISGSLHTAGRDVPLTGRLRGDRINFRAGPAHYSARVDGDTIRGTIQSGSGYVEWTATR